MTTLSWLIYFAGVVSSLNAFLNLLSFFTFAAGLAWIFFGFIGKADRDAKINAIFAKSGRNGITLIILGVFCGTFSAILPDRKTVMYIAAAEYGQAILANPKVQEVTNDSFELLQTWIKTQTEELKKQK